MFLHYLKIAWRNLLKYKAQTIISIVGLTIGVAFFTYGYHWYTFETTYDSFHPNSDRIYRVYGVYKNSGKQYPQGFTPYIAVDKLIDAFPEIEEVAIQFPNHSSSFKHDGKDLGYPMLHFVNESFFQVFPPKIILGNIDNNRVKENEIYITESYAREHFDDLNNAIGETLISGYSHSYVIKAILADPPENTLFQGNGYVLDKFVTEFSKMTDESIQWRDFMDARPFFLLHANTNVNKFQEKLRTFAIDNDYNDNLLFETVHLSEVGRIIHDPFTKITFDIKYIRAFLLAGILLLLAAFFNYVNISISTTLARSRELNLRRVTGASPSSLTIQLFVETTLFILMVALLSLCAIELTTRVFERAFNTVIISEKAVATLFITIGVVALLLYFIVFVTLHRYMKRSTKKKNISLNVNRSYGKVSLVLQLIIGIFFITSAFVFYRQVTHMKHADWGFNKDNLLQIYMKVRDREGFLQAVKQLPMTESIIETALFTIHPNTDQMGGTQLVGIEWDGKPDDYNPTFQVIEVGDNFIEEFGLTFIDGRNFNESDFVSTGGHKTDKVIINETAARLFEMENPIGEKIVIPTATITTRDGRFKENLEIAGVVKDFHTVGLQNAPPPLIIIGYRINSRGYVNYVRVTEGMEEEGIAAIQKLIPEYRPDDENEILVNTVNSVVDKLSKTEQDLFHLFTIVAMLCVLIAIFGIYSVSQRETQRRRKEIAIRKTAGAKTKEIMNLFFREYLRVTLVACIVALPLAGLFMHRWLQNFAYRISITWWMYALVIIVVAIIVLLTIVGQVTRAASQNPAEVVKSE